MRECVLYTSELKKIEALLGAKIYAQLLEREDDPIIPTEENRSFRQACT